MHMMEREKSVIELNLKVQKTINIAEYEMTTNYWHKKYDPQYNV